MPTYCTAADVRTYTNDSNLQTDGLDVTVAAVKARGVILFGAPTEGDTVTVDGTTFTYSATPGAASFADIDELTELIDELSDVSAVDNGYSVTVSAAVAGVAGNSITLAKTGDALDVSGATLTGGADADETTDNTHLEALIAAAEIYIDAAAGYWERYDDEQDRVFPRLHDVTVDGVTLIPEAIKFATIAQVEFMYENQPDIEHGIMADVKPTSVSLSPRAENLMHGYIRRTGRITLPDETLYSEAQ